MIHTPSYSLEEDGIRRGAKLRREAKLQARRFLAGEEIAFREVPLEAGLIDFYSNRVGPAAFGVGDVFWGDVVEWWQVFEAEVARHVNVSEARRALHRSFARRIWATPSLLRGLGRISTPVLTAAIRTIADACADMSAFSIFDGGKPTRLRRWFLAEMRARILPVFWPPSNGREVRERDLLSLADTLDALTVDDAARALENEISSVAAERKIRVESALDFVSWSFGRTDEGIRCGSRMELARALEEYDEERFVRDILKDVTGVHSLAAVFHEYPRRVERSWISAHDAFVLHGAAAARPVERCHLCMAGHVNGVVEGIDVVEDMRFHTLMDGALRFMDTESRAIWLEIRAVPGGVAVRM